LIKRLKRAFNIVDLCKAFGVYRSSYGYWAKRLSNKKLEPQRIKERAFVKNFHAASKGSAGTRMISQAAATAGIPLTRYMARKHMNDLGLVSSQVPAHKYRKGGNEHIAVPNALDRQFKVDRPNQVWCGDVTYIWTGRRWGYLAVVLDLYARQVAGCVSLPSSAQC